LALNHRINGSRSTEFRPHSGLNWEEPKVLIYLGGRKGGTGNGMSSCRVAGPGEEHCGCFILQLALWSSVRSLKCATLCNQCHYTFCLLISSILLCSCPAHVQDVPRWYRQKKLGLGCNWGSCCVSRWSPSPSASITSPLVTPFFRQSPQLFVARQLFLPFLTPWFYFGQAHPSSETHTHYSNSLFLVSLNLNW